MAEERTVGLARAMEQMSEEPSKEELQRRLGEARHSITSTVSEIKDTVAHQVQAVKDTLDWKEQFKKRPIVWSAAAMGAGFATGYCIASYAKGEDDEYRSAIDRVGREAQYYASQAPVGEVAMPATYEAPPDRRENGKNNSGPGFFQRVASTPAYESVRNEAGSIGDAFVQEIAQTAKSFVLPALITTLRNFIGEHLPNTPKGQSPETVAQRESRPGTQGYQPSLDRNRG